MRLVSIPPPSGPQPPHDPRDFGGPYPGLPPQGAHPPQQFPYGGQQGLAPYGLYGPYGPRPPAAVNGVAVAALVFGVLCFLPAVGLVLGLVALWQIRRRGERGRGMAIAGAALSSLGLALWTVSLATGFAADVWEAVEDGARGNSVLTLRKGDCFDSPGGLEGWAADADPVPCAGEHDGEVFAVVTVPDGAFPGEDDLSATADDRCYDLRDAYVMDGWALPAEVDVYYLLPSRESWRFGDREITCVFGNRDAQQTLTGSLRRDETTLDAHQLAYLEAADVLNDALDRAPEAEYVEDDLPGHKEWAAEMAAALAEQTRLLREHRWPADAQRPVRELTADLDEAEEEWAKAAASGDVDTYYEHYDRGWDLVDPDGSVTARKALGLATAPPVYDEEAERDTDSGGMQV
ncbi:DUF4190 domain-containing protein [Streptomyces sp. SID7804]|jgi:hypothetical protein|uniref:DUF4190 domain-containing protein n=1 Tax=Streptomyces calvus TaxID=67282 RepID=A0A514JPH7_9ACTN|nr:DUF4190 domain-containing protein [Streptomyces sp. SID7804]MYS27333.1 DUF4190 domain-containing protein [Streptomyces sp. SID7804]QDI69237.1 hypothetical protein CD934_11385 [Streptomyces calvus]